MPSKGEILKLYKQLLRYGQQLHLTDKKYYQQRIVNEFKKNKELDKKEDIDFNFQAKRTTTFEQRTRFIMISRAKIVLNSINAKSFLYLPLRNKKGIDYSRVPTFNESDVEEKFVRGSGPGGSAVNKNSNCVVLSHKPSGIVIKCHQSRSLDDNRKIAREILVSKLDDINNGDLSVNSQLKALQEKKFRNMEWKRNKLNSLKAAWKIREGLD